MTDAERFRDTALAYEARARKLREDGDSVFAEQYETAAAGWRREADQLEAPALLEQPTLFRAAS